jgi:hypothetical protein
MSTVIIMPPATPPRREIVSDGVRYREVRPGDDAPWWVIALWCLGGLVAVLIMIVIMMKWVFPFMEILIRL